jgi:energy-coupling factor transporter ATP-binding protein EcfA2
MADKREVLETMIRMKEHIREALIAEGLHAQELRAKRGYLTISFKLSLSNPTSANIAKIKNLGPSISQRSGISSVRVDVGGGNISVEYPSPYPTTPGAELFGHYMRGANLCVGFDNWGEPQYVNIKNHSVISFIGNSGSGKTTAMQAILYGMQKTNPIKFVVFSEKSKDWESWRKTQACVGVFGDVGQIEEMLTQAVDNMHTISKSGQPSNPSLLIVDDLQSLLNQNPKIGKLVGNIASIGRALKSYIFIGTTAVGSNETSGGFILEDAMAARLVFATSSNTAASRATGKKGSGAADLTALKGDALLVTPSGTFRTTTGYVTDQQVNAFLPLKSKNEHPIVTPKKQISTASRVDLPKVSPCRLLTEEEVGQVVAYCEYQKGVKGKYPSLTFVTETVYGQKKNNKNYPLMLESLGEYADVIKSTIKPPGRTGKEVNPVRG